MLSTSTRRRGALLDRLLNNRYLASLALWDTKFGRVILRRLSVHSQYHTSQFNKMKPTSEFTSRERLFFFVFGAKNVWVSSQRPSFLLAKNFKQSVRNKTFQSMSPVSKTIIFTCSFVPGAIQMTHKALNSDRWVLIEIPVAQQTTHCHAIGRRKFTRLMYFRLCANRASNRCWVFKDMSNSGLTSLSLSSSPLGCV